MKSIVLIGALVALVSFVAADVSEVDGTAATPNQQTQTASEAPVQKVHVLNPGEKEYLSPNLIGLQNIAISNIPVTMDFINIIDAFREVVDGVRYEIVLNAVNTTDNNTEIVCRLVVLEKPWLTTLWGDKVRLLQESNCTSEELLDAHRDRKSIEEKYETNAVFTGTRNELTADDISKLESQIFTSSNPQMKRTRTTTTTTTAATPTSTTTTESVESEVVTEPTNPSSVVETQPEADETGVSESTEEVVVSASSTEATQTTSTEKVPELSDDEKKWLDDFLSIGAYNFETSLQNRRADSVNSEAQAGDQEAGKRAKRGLAGGIRQLDAQELKLASESLSQSLEKIAAGDGPKYTVAEVYSGTTQVVSGSLTKLEVALNEDGQASPVRCKVSIWAQPWLKKDGYEVSFDCKDKPASVHRHSRSVDEPKEKHSKHHEEHMRHIEYSQKKSHKKNHSLDKTEHLFSKFQRKFKKTYHTSMERQMRLRIFKHNLKLIQDLNKNEMGSAKYGITEFADMTTTEYRERTGLLAREESNALRSEAKIPDVELPKEFDWREKGVVSPVKNQGNCGSCWAFSVTGNIEGLHAVKTGKLEEYSEQELLDCDTIDSACQGGLPDNAYQAIEKIGGLELESEYPYEGKKGKCHFDNSLTRVKVSGAVDLPKNETAMAQWLITNGPISIGINANAMQFYRGGVSHPWKVLCSKGNLDHGVLIVGYGVSDYPMFKKTLPYWIVKNSWGPKWGEQGYYRVYRGDNTCGVSEMATSAILA